MSSSKRPHEEGSHLTPLVRPLEETGVHSGLMGKLTTPVSTDFHVSFESGQDGRMAKLQRTEPREVDRRSPLLHRMSPSANTCVDHLNTSESRSEVRNLKECRDIKTDNRETRLDVKEFYSDMRKDTSISKSGSEVRLDNRVDEKEFKSDRGSYIDYKGDAKSEKESANSHAYSKELKENHKGKTYFESSMDNLDSWRGSRHGLQNTMDVANLRTENWDSLEAHEVVGECRIDMKGEENFREDRKRKEEKFRDFGEKNEDKDGWWNNTQLGEASIEQKELSREEKGTERWERERKDAQRDKEFIDKDKDDTKRGSPAVNEKENCHHEVDMVDGSVKISEQEAITSEPRRHKDESSKFGKDFKDQKKDKDTDIGHRHEQRGKCSDKELDDGSVEGDGATERNREISGNGIQQRKRMARTRGTLQTPLQEPRLWSRACENEGAQGKPEVSTLVCKVGECMKEILKLWKEFEASQEDKSNETHQNYPTLEIRIPADHVTLSNRRVKGVQLWGTDVYTNDSDLLTVLIHTGYCRPTSTPPAGAQELRATVQVLPPQEEYTSTCRNNIRSRAWGAGVGCSFSVQRCCIVKKSGGTIDLEPHITYTYGLEPTVAPVSVERTMTTRSAASNALHQQRFVHEVPIQYNLCNEPWLKYSITVVADKGLKKALYTSARLKKGEVLYFETPSKRYELCYNGEKVLSNGTGATSFQNHSSHVQNGDRNVAENTVDIYRWSRCKKILLEETMLSNGIPFHAEDLEVIEDNLEWEDLQWSQTGVMVSGKTYNLARVHFLAPKKK